MFCWEWLLLLSHTVALQQPRHLLLLKQVNTFQVLPLRLQKKLSTLEGYVLFQHIAGRMVILEVLRDAFSYNEEAECLGIIVKPVVHA